MAHTQGPWLAEYPDEWSMDQGVLVLGGTNGAEPVCEILGPLDDEDGPHRGHYDLALITSAPALLAACEEAVRVLRQHLIHTSPFGAVAVGLLEDAVANAKGNPA